MARLSARSNGPSLIGAPLTVGAVECHQESVLMPSCFAGIVRPSLGGSSDKVLVRRSKRKGDFPNFLIPKSIVVPSPETDNVFCQVRSSTIGGSIAQMTSPLRLSRVKQGLYFTTSSSPVALLRSSVVVLSGCPHAAERPRRAACPPLSHASTTRLPVIS